MFWFVLNMSWRICFEKKIPQRGTADAEIWRLLHATPDEENAPSPDLCLRFNIFRSALIWTSRLTGREISSNYLPWNGSNAKMSLEFWIGLKLCTGSWSLRIRTGLTDVSLSDWLLMPASCLRVWFFLLVCLRFLFISVPCPLWKINSSSWGFAAFTSVLVHLHATLPGSFVLVIVSRATSRIRVRSVFGRLTPWWGTADVEIKVPLFLSLLIGR